MCHTAPPLPQAFAELDTDGDGVLSIEEIVSSLRNKLPPAEVSLSGCQGVWGWGCAVLS